MVGEAVNNSNIVSLCKQFLYIGAYFLIYKVMDFKKKVAMG